MGGMNKCVSDAVSAEVESVIPEPDSHFRILKDPKYIFAGAIYGQFD